MRTLSPPHPALVRGEATVGGGGGTVFDSPSSQQQLLLTGHPREGQAASLLGNKYLLLEELEGSSLHRCLHLPTRQEFVCKVSILPRFLPSVLVFVHGAGCEYS